MYNEAGEAQAEPAFGFNRYKLGFMGGVTKQLAEEKGSSFRGAVSVAD